MSTLFTLRAEIAACLIGVAVLGLIAGWMMQRARASSQLDALTRSSRKRYAELEASARQDEQNLEERLQALAAEARTLKAENRALRETVRGRDESSDGARTEAIEQNRRQAETQERLQRIIREREREIAVLQASLESRGGTPRAPEAAASERSVRSASVTALVGADALDETMRIDPAQLPDAHVLEAANERLPAGGVPKVESAPAGAEASRRDEESAPFDESLDSTIEVTMLDAEEATVALDDEALALVREFGRGGER